jgi:hypothetical protein
MLTMHSEDLVMAAEPCKRIDIAVSAQCWCGLTGIKNIGTRARSCLPHIFTRSGETT